MSTQSSIFAWKISRTEEPGGLQSTGSQRVWKNLATEHTYKVSNNCLCDGKCSALTYFVTFRQNMLNNEISPQSFPLPSPLPPILCLLLFHRQKSDPECLQSPCGREYTCQKAGGCLGVIHSLLGDSIPCIYVGLHWQVPYLGGPAAWFCSRRGEWSVARW